MAVSPHPWSVKGVSEEARAIAKAKAHENHMNIGTWLSNAIMMAALQEAKENHAYHQLGQAPENPNENPTAVNAAGVLGAQSVTPMTAMGENSTAGTAVSSKAEEDAGMTFQELAKLVLQLATRLATVEQRQQQKLGSLQGELESLRNVIVQQPTADTNIQQLAAAIEDLAEGEEQTDSIADDTWDALDSNDQDEDPVPQLAAG